MCVCVFSLKLFLEAEGFLLLEPVRAANRGKAEPNENDINQQSKYQWMKAETLLVPQLS